MFESVLLLLRLPNNNLLEIFQTDVPFVTDVELLTIAELGKLDTCHSKIPPDTEGVNALEILFKLTDVAGKYS